MSKNDQKHGAKSGTTASALKDLNVDQEQLEEARLLEHPSYIELQNKLTEAEEKSAQNWDKILRIQAEKDNLERRTEIAIANAHKFALEKFVSGLLEVVDNLERAIEHADGNMEGVNLTLRSLVTTMEKFGVEQVNPVSEAFNPEYHQAVATQEESSMKPGTVLTVMQKGYLLNGRLVRPALVVVSK